MQILFLVVNSLPLYFAVVSVFYFRFSRVWSQGGPSCGASHVAIWLQESISAWLVVSVPSTKPWLVAPQVMNFMTPAGFIVAWLIVRVSLSLRWRNRELQGVGFFLLWHNWAGRGRIPSLGEIFVLPNLSVWKSTCFPWWTPWLIVHLPPPLRTNEKSSVKPDVLLHSWYF